MSPYVDVFFNDGGAITIVYMGKIELGKSCEPQHIVLETEHLPNLIEAIEKIM